MLNAEKPIATKRASCSFELSCSFGVAVIVVADVVVAVVGAVVVEHVF